MRRSRVRVTEEFDKPLDAIWYVLVSFWRLERIERSDS